MSALQQIYFFPVTAMPVGPTETPFGDTAVPVGTTAIRVGWMFTPRGCSIQRKRLRRPVVRMFVHDIILSSGIFARACCNR